MARKIKKGDTVLVIAGKDKGKKERFFPSFRKRKGSSSEELT